MRTGGPIFQPIPERPWRRGSPPPSTERHQPLPPDRACDLARTYVQALQTTQRYLQDAMNNLVTEANADRAFYERRLSEGNKTDEEKRVMRVSYMDGLKRLAEQMQQLREQLAQNQAELASASAEESAACAGDAGSY